MPWRITCPPARFLQLKADPAFQHLMVAAKIANALRFAIVAAMERNGKPDGHTTIRARAGSFNYVSGLVLEALKFLPQLGTHYAGEPAFQQHLEPLLHDPKVASLRNGPLKRLRNQAVFHNDLVVMSNGLDTLILEEYELMAGDGDTGADVYFPVADLALIHHALSTNATGLLVLKQMSDLLDQVADLGTELCQGIDTLSQSVLLGLGCTYYRD